MAVPWHSDWLVVPAAELSEIPQLAGVEPPHVIEPSTNEQFGITSANSSAYSQFPGFTKSHFITEFPVDSTTKRRLNITPLNETGTKLNHAALN